MRKLSQKSYPKIRAQSQTTVCRLAGKSTHKFSENSQSGFTIVEVMLVLGIAGLMLVGLIGGTFTAIARQRYNDTINNFADYLETAYSEVISPKTVGAGNSTDNIILGKVLVFGHDYGDAETNRNIYKATLIGKNSSLKTADANQGFLNELLSAETGASLYCGNSSTNTSSSVESYAPLWEAELKQATDTPGIAGIYTAEYDKEFKGTIIIARAPSSSVVHTIYAPNKTYDLKNGCQPDNNTASSRLQEDFKEQRDSHARNYFIGYETGFCVKSDNSAVSREIRIAADGRNSSAIWVRNTDAFESGDEDRCRL